MTVVYDQYQQQNRAGQEERTNDSLTHPTELTHTRTHDMQDWHH